MTEQRTANHHNASTVLGAVDRPLPIASAIQGQWKSRRKVHQTPRRLATLKINVGGDGSSKVMSSEDDNHPPSGLGMDISSGIQVCIAGDEYIVVANTTASNLYVFQLSQQPRQPTATAIATDSTLLTLPWAVVPLTNQIDDANDATHDNITTMETKTKQQSSQLPDTSPANIVCLMALPFGQSLIYGETCRHEEGHVVAFTDDGQGIIVRIRKDDSATKIFEFSTLNFGVTCATVIPTSKDSEDYQLLVGYQTGYLENWKIFRFSTDKILAKMTWRGMYPNNYHIQQIAPLHVVDEEEKEESHEENSMDTDNNRTSNNQLKKDETSLNSTNDRPPKDSATATTAASTTPSPPSLTRKHSFSNIGRRNNHRYLLITLYSPKRTSQKTCDMVEVIDIEPLAMIWKQNDSHEQQQQYGQKGLIVGGRLRAINLSKRWIMPAPGMEILNSATIRGTTSESLPKRAHVIPSIGTGCICTLPEGNCAALADGTIALLSSTEKGDGELQWGITNDYNQLLLPYPVIGCASLYWAHNAQQEESTPHVACCLRGGSCYLVPFVPPNNDDKNLDIDEITPITVFTLETASPARYVQSFTAGNLILSTNNKSQPLLSSAHAHASASTDRNNSTLNDSTLQPTSTTTTPVLIYAWASGVIDVYSCELMESSSKSYCRSMIGHRERLALEELVANGSTGLLSKLLSSLDESDPLLHQPLWKDAWKEAKSEPLDKATASGLSLPKFRASRSLLLLLSTNTLNYSSHTHD